MFEAISPPEFKELFYERFATRSAVSRVFLRDADLDIVAGHVFDELVFRLEKEVLTDKLAEDTLNVTFLHDASWWDHFKRENWRLLCDLGFVALRLVKPPNYVVSVKTVRVKSFALFPEPTVVYPKELGRVVRYQTVGVESVVEDSL